MTEMAVLSIWSASAERSGDGALNILEVSAGHITPKAFATMEAVRVLREEISPQTAAMQERLPQATAVLRFQYGRDAEI
jgi:hypothetical protein